MSCNWDVYCVTCSKGLGMEVSDVEYMRALIRNAPALAAIGGAIASIDPRASIDSEFQVGCRVFSPRWFAVHAGHELRPMDQYNRLDGQCARPVTCDCGGRHDCQLDIGHSGSCDGRRWS